LRLSNNQNTANSGLSIIYDIHNRFNAINQILLRKDFNEKLGINYFGKAINGATLKIINKSDLTSLDSKLTSFNLTTKKGVAIPVLESKASIFELKDLKRVKEVIFFQQNR
jgi:hypothetical protein